MNFRRSLAFASGWQPALGLMNATAQSLSHHAGNAILASQQPVQEVSPGNGFGTGYNNPLSQGVGFGTGYNNPLAQGVGFGTGYNNAVARRVSNNPLGTRRIRRTTIPRRMIGVRRGSPRLKSLDSVDFRR